MKRLFAILILLAAVLELPAATVTFTWTNSFGQLDTNAFRIVPIGSNILYNGGVVIRGPAIRMANPTGIVSTNLSLGWYMATNAVLGDGIVFQVPANNNTYLVGQLAVSGLNTYNVSGILGLTSSDGSVHITPTNGVGWVDLSGLGGVASNVLQVVAGTNTVVETNSLERTVNVKAGSLGTNMLTSAAYDALTAGGGSDKVNTNNGSAWGLTAYNPVLNDGTAYGVEGQIAFNFGLRQAYAPPGEGQNTTALFDWSDPGALVVFTNLDVRGTNFGNAYGLTNANATTLFGSGTVPVARLGTGTPTGSKFLRDDNTWQTISAGGGDVYLAQPNVMSASNTFNGGFYMAGNYNVFVGTEQFEGATRFWNGSLVSTNALFASEAGSDALRAAGNMTFLSGYPVTVGTSSNSTSTLLQWVAGFPFTFTDSGFLGVGNFISTNGLNSGGAVTVYNGALTVQGGIYSTNDVVAVGSAKFVGDGSGLTNLPAGGGGAYFGPEFTNSVHYGVTTFGTNEASGVLYVYPDGTRRYTNSTTHYSEVFTNGQQITYNGSDTTSVSNLNATGIIYGSMAGGSNVPGIINVKDYGAATNLADNSTAFNAAIQALTNTFNHGGKLEIPHGTFAMTGPVWVYPNITLSGAGSDSTVLSCSGSSTSAVNYVDVPWNVYLDTVKLTGLRVTCSSALAVDAIRLAANAARPIKPIVEDVKVIGPFARGIYIDEAEGGRVQDCHVNSTYGDGFTFDQYTLDMTVSGCYSKFNGGWGFVSRLDSSIALANHADANTNGGFYLAPETTRTLYAGNGAEGNKTNEFRIEAAYGAVDLINCYVNQQTSILSPGVTNYGFWFKNAYGVNLRNPSFYSDTNSRTNKAYAIYLESGNTGIDVELTDYNGQGNWGNGLINDLSQVSYYRSNGVVTATSFNGNAYGLTNALLSSLVSPTNAMAAMAVNFANPETTTNTSSAFTLTDPINVNATNYNAKIIHVIASGADRLISFPGSWHSNWFGEQLTATNGGVLDLLITAQVNQFTNIARCAYR